MIILPKPELLAACRIVLGADDRETVLAALRASGLRWAQVMEAEEAIHAVRSLPNPSIDAVTRMFDSEFADIDTAGRRAIVHAAATILQSEADDLRKEAKALEAYGRKRTPANDG